MSIQALREQRAAKAKTLNELVTKATWNDATDKPIYDSGMAELDSIDAQISRITALNEKVASDALNNSVIEAAARIGHNSGNTAATLYAKWLRGGDNALNAEERGVVFNTMSTTTNTEGGYTVQTDIASTVINSLKAFGGMRSVATVIRTDAGNPMSFPTSDGTAETGEQVAENTVSTNADLVFGTVALNCYKFSSKDVAVPIELLQDSSVDIEAFVRQRLVTRLGRITNTRFTLGTGSSQPNGIITAASTGVTAANGTSAVTAVLYSNLVDLVHSVDPAYRALGNCSWMMNDASVKVIRKIVDSQGRPYLVPGYEMKLAGESGSAPDTLLGYPITVNQDIAVMAASAKSIAFGDFSFYYIRDAMNVEMQRYNDSAYAKKGQVGFLAWLRSGGNLLDTGAVKLFVNAAS